MEIGISTRMFPSSPVERQRIAENGGLGCGVGDDLQKW
jgi:hypothetical protein